MYIYNVYRDGGIRRDDPVLVPERGGRGDARHATDDIVRHAETLLDDGAKVREGFEMAPERDSILIRDDDNELDIEGYENTREAEYIEGDNREGGSDRFVARDDKQDALVREAVQALLFGGHFLVVRHLVEDGRDRLGFGFDLHFRICRLGDLLFNYLFGRFSSVR